MADFNMQVDRRSQTVLITTEDGDMHLDKSPRHHPRQGERPHRHSGPKGAGKTKAQIETFRGVKPRNDSSRGRIEEID